MNLSTVNSMNSLYHLARNSLCLLSPKEPRTKLDAEKPPGVGSKPSSEGTPRSPSRSAID